MKTIGLIGGMSWESSALYYRLINEETKRKLGGGPEVITVVEEECPAPMPGEVRVRVLAARPPA